MIKQLNQDELNTIYGGVIPGVHSPEEEALLKECEEMNECEPVDIGSATTNPHSKRYKGGLAKKNN